MSDKLTRIAIVSADRCKPKKCRQECKKGCPVVKTGEHTGFATMSVTVAHRSLSLSLPSLPSPLPLLELERCGTLHLEAWKQKLES